jgi:hypothetical protein
MDPRTGKMLGDLIPPEYPRYQGTGDGAPPPNLERAASASEDDELSRILQSIAKISNLKFTTEIGLVHSREVKRWQIEEVLESGLGEPWMIDEFLDGQRNEPWVRELKEKWGEGRRKEPPTKSPHGMELLGVYIPSERKIVIYDVVCKMVGHGLKLAREKDLVSVVLAHEAAHAVTHLGEDLQGRIWDTFEIASDEDVELFAQIYDLLHVKNADPNLEKVFRELATRQSRVYNTWTAYENKPVPEVNDALIEARLKPPSLKPPSPTRKLIEGYLARRYQPNLRAGTERVLRYIEDLEARMENPDWVWERGYRVADVIIDNARQPDGGDLSEFNVNIIPRRRRGSLICAPILVVAVGFGRDGLEARVREAAKHVSEDCVGVTKAVIFWTTRWDSVKWMRYAESFQNVVVYLKLVGVEHVKLQ